MTWENPFHYGSPASGEFFADRQEVLDDITARMMTAQNVILLSPRRYGKTSLLLRAIELVKAAGGRPSYANMIRCTSARDVAEYLLNAVLRGPLSWATAQRHRLGSLFRRFRISPRLEVDPQTGNLSGSFSPSISGVTDWRAVLEDVAALLAEASGSEGPPVSLVLDEFQHVAEIDPSLPGVFKGLADQLDHVSLVFAGSKLHLMERLATGPGAPLLGMGERISLDIIEEAPMVAYLVARSQAGRKPMSREVAKVIFERAAGIPNEVQCLAHQAYQLAATEIDEETVKLALQRVVHHRALDYEDLFERLAPVHQRILRALAAGPRTAVFSRAFLDEVSAANANSVRTGLAALEDRELVRRHGREWLLADPFFGQWLAARESGF